MAVMMIVEYISVFKLSKRFEVLCIEQKRSCKGTTVMIAFAAIPWLPWTSWMCEKEIAKIWIIILNLSFLCAFQSQNAQKKPLFRDCGQSEEQVCSDSCGEGMWVCDWVCYFYLRAWSTVSQTLHEADGHILRRRVGLACGHCRNASTSSDTFSPEAGVPIHYIKLYPLSCTKIQMCWVSLPASQLWKAKSNMHKRCWLSAEAYVCL